MKSLTRQMYAIHSAIGVVAGLLLFAVMFTGTIALFREEVSGWEHPSLRFELTGEMALDDLLKAHAERIPRDVHDIFVFLPDAIRPSVRVQMQDHGKSVWFDIDPRTGKILPTGQHGFSMVWRRIHTDLLLGRTGRYLVGLSGLIALLAIVSGLFAHRKMFKQLFTWRRGRSFRVRIGDLHKLLGVWGSAVHLLFGFTGAILGLLSLLILASAFVAYEGDQEAAVEAVLGPPVEHSGEEVPFALLAPLLNQARQHDGKVEWSFARLMHWGDANAHVELSGFPSDAISMARIARFRVRDGALVHHVDWQDSPWHRAFGMVQPLHYADFGGALIKLLYVVFGLAGTLLVASGLLIWLDGRSRRKVHSLGSQRVLAGFTAGVLGGFPLATFALPLADRLWAQGTNARFEFVTATYVGLLVASVLVALVRPPWHTLRGLLMVSASCALGAPILDILLVGWEAAFVTHSPTAITNGAFILVAVLCAGTAYCVIAMAARQDALLDDSSQLSILRSLYARGGS